MHACISLVTGIRSPQYHGLFPYTTNRATALCTKRTDILAIHWPLIHPYGSVKFTDQANFYDRTAIYPSEEAVKIF